MKVIGKGWLLTILAVLLAIAMAGCSGGSSKSEDSGKTGKKNNLAGQTLRFVACNHVWTEAIKPLIPEFEKQTGIKVNIESYAEEPLSQKLAVEFTSGASTIDVFMNRPHQEGLLFTKNKWYEPLNNYINNPEITPADWDWNDFMASAVQATTNNGTIFGVPIISEATIIYYRKDLFQQANLTPPTTFEELEAAAKKLNNPSSGIAGIVARGQRGLAVSQFAGYLFGFGGDFLKDGKCVLDTPEAVAAFKYYGKLLHDYGPPGTTNMSWPQASALFASGKAAMLTDSSGILSAIIDPSKSTVADKVGFAVFPAGPKGLHPYFGAPWALSISASSKHKEAAWEFVKWLSSKEVMKKAQLVGNTGTRKSVWNDPEVLAKMPKGFAEVVEKSGEVGVPYCVPRMTAVGEARDAIGEVIVKSIETGGQGDIEALAKEATRKINDLLAKTGEGGQ
ncbi:MAG: sugar ABC transporter substrate-binding protein [Moorella humiferrea]|nr:sugar ABC transporter substrate-binding protein [Moorella humiferrea]